jgi:hypothetical protein
MRERLGVTLFFAALGACGCSGGGAQSTPLDGGNRSGTDSGIGPAGGDAASTEDSSASSADTGAILPPDGGSIDYDQVAPTPPADWVNVTNNLTGLSSECGNVSGVFTDPRADRLLVGISLNGLFASTDGAMTWTSIGTTGATIKNRMSMILFDPTNVGTFWESGIDGAETSTAGLFMTTDNGTSFTAYTSLMSLSGYGNTNDSVSVDFTDPDRKTMLAGTHEGTGQLFLSTDTGTTWSNIGTNLPAGIGFCTQVLVLDSDTLIAGCANSYASQPGGIVRSTDGGQTFTTVSSTVTFGHPLWASDGSIYFDIEGGGLTKSVDQGVTWTTVADANTAGSVAPIELPNGFIVSSQQATLVVSADKGTTWTPIGTPMPYVPEQIAYSPFRRAFYASNFTCTAPYAVPANGIVSFGWDYEAQDAGL